MTHILAVAAGGAAGSVLRYLASRWVPGGGTTFPWNTLLINAVGCGLLGLFLGAADSRLTTISPELRSMVSIGLLGGFTTFSTFGHQTVALWQDGRTLAATANVALSVCSGLLAAWAGWRLASSL